MPVIMSIEILLMAGMTAAAVMPARDIMQERLLPPSRKGHALIAADTNK